MLVLSRKNGESIVISNQNGTEQIEITIVETLNDRVKIGINADRDFKILRKELVETQLTNKEASAGRLTSDLKSFMSRF